MTKTTGRLLATALAVWLAGASAARAEYMGWTYSFDDSGLTINPNAGQASGAIGIALPAGGSATTAIPNVILEASTSALGTAASPADQYVNAPYSVTLTIADPTANQSHDFTFNGLINGSAAASNFQLTNTFSNGSQDSTLAGHDYLVTAGPFVLSPTTGAGSIGFAVQVNDPTTQAPPPAPPPSPSPSTAPEPTSLVLACLTLPAIGLTGWNRRKAILSRA
jgi:hypothetical protein